MSGNPASEMLSLSMRPKRFSEIVGAAGVITTIRNLMKSGRRPKAWMMFGETGCGKTSIARILAVSLQCPHQSQFGESCDDCYDHRSKFDILEVNASDLSGADDMRQIGSACLYTPKPPSKCRVFILDELQRASSASKEILLKYFEDAPASSVWIICTTDPEKIVKPLRGRCIPLRMPLLQVDDVGKLVARAMKFVGATSFLIQPLIDCLLENSVFSPRAVLMSVEKYLSTGDAKGAVVCDSETALDTRKLWIAITEGDWPSAMAFLKTIQPDESWTFPNSLSGWLRDMIIKGDKRSAVAAWGIAHLSAIHHIEDSKFRYAAFTGIAFELSMKFRGGK